MLSLSQSGYSPLALCRSDFPSQESPASYLQQRAHNSSCSISTSSSKSRQEKEDSKERSKALPSPFVPYRQVHKGRSASDSSAPCEWPMNGPESRASSMTGPSGLSTGGPTEGLTWLADVATGAQSATSSPPHDLLGASRLLRQPPTGYTNPTERLFTPQYPVPVPHPVYHGQRLGQHYSFLSANQYGSAPPPLAGSLVSRQFLDYPLVAHRPGSFMPVPGSLVFAGQPRHSSYSSMPKSKTPEEQQSPPSSPADRLHVPLRQLATSPKPSRDATSSQSPASGAYSREEGKDDLTPAMYRVPSGKEGSLKHRILRPPSINIIEPPASVLGNAPLSAPPIRGPREEIPSPKFPRLNTPRLCVPAQQSANQLHYPAYFMKGSIIQLGNGHLKKVEDLNTDDFVNSANVSQDLRIDSSVVMNISESSNDSVVLGFSVGHDQVQVTVEAPLEHPFFVFNRGWSSCSPERSIQRYGLNCHKLNVGDVCISVTHRRKSSLKDESVHTKSKESSSDSASKGAENSKETGDVGTVPSRVSPSVVTDLMNPLNVEPANKRKRRWSAPDHIPVEDASKPT